ncbi:hypothetical protein COX69_02850 [Candidatus Falkowbacteria bacterium CG_4_10_14_0_2_um_filter_48_10]|uniref:Uncharacterized protein n=1 Tax=Candidatus Falkowbacteria bacterium CG23_combo_of_CG06-09_8_20_14_all_49_15 TaxID=1974572 RepID=A0A2G9ZM34_9BACT|nr:MAG: hypothetical protein COX22_04515 [Candidatus Falkowbacteria bacterium CG23_combo_of_CG06-09_8_20_14_all_49_15]PJA08222.1 MAG: hypothetical protein COX69_02850 [Candidatus Falkowbacteria bacterium CG_4_10_14_0_2_um_filter_48_10]
MNKEKGLIKILTSRRTFFYGHILVLFCALAVFTLATLHLYHDVYLVLTGQTNNENILLDSPPLSGELKSERLKNIVEKINLKKTAQPAKELPNIF